MTELDHAAHLTEQNRRLGELVAAGLDTPVPTCPGWTLRTLATHVGRGDRWAATLVEDRATEFVDPRSVPGGKPPEGPGEIADWLAGGVARLHDAVAATGARTTVWTFLGPRPAGWWVRRRLHEVVVHRADAALALGVPFDVPAPVAADGVSEWLAMVAARPRGAQPPLDEGATLHLHATDDGLGAGGEWMVRHSGGGVVWEHGHGKGAVAVRGAAADLLLAVVRRIPAGDARLQVLGDAAVFDAWLGRTPFWRSDAAYAGSSSSRSMSSPSCQSPSAPRSYRRMMPTGRNPARRQLRIARSLCAAGSVTTRWCPRANRWRAIVRSASQPRPWPWWSGCSARSIPAWWWSGSVSSR
jgi:uncharacterized protein (TIGR03083 family)